MDGAEEKEENGHGYAKMEGKTDGGRANEDAVWRLETKEHIEHRTYCRWKTSELMRSA